MFDVGFFELLLIGVVALLVLGPERLPAAARSVGSVLRKARQSWTHLRHEFERELDVEDMKRNVQTLRAHVESGRPITASATPQANEAPPGDAEPPPGMAPAPTRAPHD